MGNIYSYAIAHIEKEFVAVQNLSSNEEAARRNITYQELRNISTSDDIRLNLDHIAILYSMDANRDGVFSYDDLVAFAMWCATNLPKDITGSEFSDAVQARCVLRLWSDCKEKGNDVFVEWMCGFLQRAHPCEGPRGTPSYAIRSRSQSEVRTRKSSVHSGSHNSRRMSHGSGGGGSSITGYNATGSTAGVGGDTELFQFNPPQSVNTEKLSGSVNSARNNNNTPLNQLETQRPSVGNTSITGSQGGGSSSGGIGGAGSSSGTTTGTAANTTGFKIDLGDSPTHLGTGPHATVGESFEVPSSETDEDDGFGTDDEQELKVLPPGGAGRASSSSGVGAGGTMEKMEWFDLDALDTLYTLLNVKEGYGLDFHTFCHVLSGEPGAENAPTGRGGDFSSGGGVIAVGGEASAGRTTAHSFTWSRSIAAARSADSKAGALGFGNTQDEDLFIPGASVRTFLMAFLESYWGILQRLGLGVLLESNLDELSPDSPLGPERRGAQQQQQASGGRQNSSNSSSSGNGNQHQQQGMGKTSSSN